ncbi:hypothetical protein J6590_099120 [Homalodisca vitripennis]|nr:hypothetical protein J6590_099120 [Homalodisca vitripennis]
MNNDRTLVRGISTSAGACQALGRRSTALTPPQPLIYSSNLIGHVVSVAHTVGVARRGGGSCGWRDALSTAATLVTTTSVSVSTVDVYTCMQTTKRGDTSELSQGVIAKREYVKQPNSASPIANSVLAVSATCMQTTKRGDTPEQLQGVIARREYVKQPNSASPIPNSVLAVSARGVQTTKRGDTPEQSQGVSMRN